MEISAVSVKPDKLQKLRRIAASVTNSASDDIIISSTGSSPSSSPRPENLTALSKPIDPAELYARLTVLVREDQEDEENHALESGDGNLQDGEGVKNSEDDAKGQSMDKNMNIPVSIEEFYAVRFFCFFKIKSTKLVYIASPARIKVYSKNLNIVTQANIIIIFKVDRQL